MRELKFKIGGLHCHGCVQSVTTILRARPDVQTAEVHLETGLATLSVGEGFDSSAARLAVQAAGFSLQPA